MKKKNNNNKRLNCLKSVHTNFFGMENCQKLDFKEYNFFFQLLTHHDGATKLIEVLI